MLTSSLPVGFLPRNPINFASKQQPPHSLSHPTTTTVSFGHTVTLPFEQLYKALQERDIDEIERIFTSIPNRKDRLTLITGKYLSTQKTALQRAAELPGERIQMVGRLIRKIDVPYRLELFSQTFFDQLPHTDYNLDLVDAIRDFLVGHHHTEYNNRMAESALRSKDPEWAAGILALIPKEQREQIIDDALPGFEAEQDIQMVNTLVGLLVNPPEPQSEG